jgi:DNA-binding response OmpR family regulator
MAKVLVVDDDPDIVEAISAVLAGKGHEVQGAHNREEGLQAARDGKPDLLVLDVMMDQPDDGMVMAQELKRDGFASPILMLTNISNITGLEYGKDDEIVPVDIFLQKPVDPAVLVEKVDELLSK